MQQAQIIGILYYITTITIQIEIIIGYIWDYMIGQLLAIQLMREMFL